MTKARKGQGRLLGEKLSQGEGQQNAGREIHSKSDWRITPRKARFDPRRWKLERRTETRQEKCKQAKGGKTSTVTGYKSGGGADAWPAGPLQAQLPSSPAGAPARLRQRPQPRPAATAIRDTPDPFLAVPTEPEVEP